MKIVEEWVVLNVQRLILKIKDLVEQTEGTWGLVLEDLDTLETWSLNEDQQFYSASVIKVPIMAAVYSLIDEGNLRLSDTYVLNRNDVVGGSGVLQHMSLGTSLTVYDLVLLMIIQSDNTATNILIDLVGMEYIQEVMEEFGMKNSTLSHKLMINPVHKSGTNQVTASDMAVLLKAIVTGKAVSVHAGKQMIDIMKKQQLTECLPGKLPYHDPKIIGETPAWEVANKTGWIPGICHDVGVFYVGQRKMIVSALSKNVDDSKSKIILADIGKEIFKYLKVDVLE